MEKRWVYRIGIAILAMISLIVIIIEKKPVGQSVFLQEDIAKEIIRFHVIANSDSKADQEVKMKVKEKITDDLQEKLKNAVDVQEARNIITEELKNIETIANTVIRKEEYAYCAKATLSYKNFPLKIYGDMAFPPGKYEALQVVLGKGKGKNWWCVMFPGLCFIDGTVSVVPEKAKKEIRSVMSEEDYESLLIKNHNKVEVRWKLAEWWEQVKEILK